MCWRENAFTVADSLQQQSALAPPAVSAWAANRQKKKILEVYATLQEKYAQFTKVNEFLNIPDALEAVITRTIPLLTNVVTTRCLKGVSGETMEEAVKSIQIKPKFHAKRSNTMWVITLPNEKEAEMLAGSVLMSKLVRLQSEYMGTWRTRITLHGVPMDFTEEQLGVFFFRYGQVEDVLARQA